MSNTAYTEDRVAATAAEWTNWAQKNTRWVAAVGAVALAAVLIPLATNGIRARGEAQASASAYTAQNTYFSGNYEQALAQFQNLSDRHGGSRAGRTASLFIGNCQLALGRPTEAEAAFRKFLGKAGSEGLDRAAGMRGLGASLMAQNKAAEAAAEFQKAGSIEDNPSAADDWMNAGRAYSEAGKSADAVHAWKTLLDRFPDYARAQEVRVRIEEMKAAS